MQGLTVAGATNPLDSGHGYIVFMRSSKGKEYSADEARAEYYRNNMQLPFITGVREVIFPELKSGAPLESHMTAVSWCDGNFSQINTITKLKNIEFNEKNYIIDNKQSAARIAIEESADLAGQYLPSKVISKSITLKNEPSNIIKNKISSTLSENRNMLRLKYNNQKALVNYCGCVPEI